MNAIGIIQENEAVTPECPYRQLWGEVLIRGLEDASGRFERTDRRSEDGSGWVGSKDFRDVCAMAGMDAGFIEGAFRKGRFVKPITITGRRRGR